MNLQLSQHENAPLKLWTRLETKQLKTSPCPMSKKRSKKTQIAKQSRLKIARRSGKSKKMTLSLPVLHAKCRKLQKVKSQLKRNRCPSPSRDSRRPERLRPKKAVDLPWPMLPSTHSPTGLVSLEVSGQAPLQALISSTGICHPPAIFTVFPIHRIL